MNRITTIVNPTSASGKTGREWHKIDSIMRGIFGHKFETCFTEGRNHATEITRECLARGTESVVVVGGDGTVNEVVNGFFIDDHPVNPTAALGIISCGTGKDFVRTLGVPPEPQAAVEMIANRKVRVCDVGKVSCMDFDGITHQRYFVNVADLGFGAEVAERVNKSSKALGGFLTFYLGLVTTLITYKNKKIRYTVDDQAPEELQVNSINIANGRWFGGGMQIAPEAQIDDGLFDIVIIQALGPLGVLTNTPRLYNGTIKEHPKVKYLKGKKIVVETEDRVLLEADGEQPGILPATFEILPKALNIIVP